MRAQLLTALSLLCLPACWIPHVRQPDLDAWREVPIIELETHPFFSTLPKRAEPLSDGSQLWDFPNCAPVSNCKGNGSEATCVGGEVCCHNQFFIRDGYVTAYRPLGRCYTDCRTRPASHRCE